MKLKKNFLRWLPLLLLFSAMCVFFYFHLYRFFTFANIKANRADLSLWAQKHYAVAVLSFIGIYSLVIASSIPIAIFFTISAGFLFGWWGVPYVMISETIGCTLIFLAVKISVGEWLEKKVGKAVKKMEHEFHKNAFNYIVTLRLIPVVPYWVVNVVSAICEVPLTTFMLATFIGVIPLSVIYVYLGLSLDTAFDMSELGFDLVLQPHILIPLVSLALLALVPVIYQHFKNKKSKKN